MVVIRYGVLAVAVPGLDEQYPGGEGIARFGSVLGGNRRGPVGGDRSVRVERDVLRGFSNQAFVGIQSVYR